MSNVFLAGKAGAGKTAISNYLKQTYYYKQAKFAHPVYAIAEHYFSMGQKDRKLLQYIGTDAGRNHISEDIWVKRLIEDLRIVRLTESAFSIIPSQYVCDDVRFFNESNALLKAGWTGLYIDVPEKIRIQRLMYRDGNAQVNALQHSSETEVEKFKDTLISIDGSVPIEDVFLQIDDIMRRYYNA